MSATVPCAGCGDLIAKKALPFCDRCKSILANGFEERAGGGRKVALATLQHFSKEEQSLISLLDAALPGLEDRDRATAGKIIRNMRTAEPKRGWQDDARAILDRVLMVTP